MVARLSAAGLGLFAFAVAVTGGLVAQNPFSVVLSRGILALFVFCLIGLVLGGTAQLVLSEHAMRREAEIRGAHQDDDESDRAEGSTEPVEAGPPPGAVEPEPSAERAS